VLFTDLVGSTELRSRVGEEAADELRREHDRLVGGAIRVHRGTVVKQLGDGLMATFTGAADGLAGAVAIQQALAQHNRRAANERLEVRIGLSVGDVTFEEDDCFGLPVIEAQRLESVAAPGQILCSDVVQLMSRGRGGHVFVPMGERELKGIDGPVTVLEVGWTPPDDTHAVREVPRLLSTEGSFGLAGRTRELESLVESWKHAVTGTLGVVLISGEPGIGKTRLVSELARRAVNDDAVILAGRCDEQVTVAYRPFADALRLSVAMVEGRPASEVLGARSGELRRLLPDLGDHVTALPDLLGGDPELERFQLLDALVDWLRTVAREAPVLLVLDDLHWADGPTLTALRHLVDEVSDARLLIVGTYRDTDLDRTHPLARALADFRRRPVVSRLDLVGLTAEGVSDFLTGAAGHELDEPGRALAEAVYRETAGNPFFIGEVLRHLAESGALVQRDGTWTSDMTLQEVGIPEGIREVVGRRLNRLSEASGKVLSAAAIVGQHFEVDLVALVADLPIDEVLDALDDAATANLVLDDGVGQYRFAHALVRGTLEDELSTTRRARLHRRTALALEELHAAHLDEHAPRLAHHWAETADPDPSTAVRWAMVAGQQNLDGGAPDDALRWFESGLELLDPDHPDPAQRAELLVLKGTALSYLADSSSAATLKEAARLALDIGDASLAAQALIVNSNKSWTRGIPSDAERLDLIARARPLVVAGDHVTMLRLLLAHAEQLLFLGDREGRLELLGEAFDILERYEVPFRSGVEAVGWLTMLLPVTAEVPPSYWDVRDRVWAGIRARGTTTDKVRNAFSQAFAAGRAGDRVAYRNAWAAFLEATPGEGSAVLDGMLQLMRIVDGQIEGSLDAVDIAATRLVEVSPASDEQAVNYRSLAGFMTARERGQMPELQPVIEALHSSISAGPTAALRASGLALAGATGLALAALEDARPFDDVADDPGYPVSVCGYAEAAIVLRHVDAAREIYPLVEAMGVNRAVLVVTGGYSVGSLSGWLARLSAVIGAHDRADEQFRAGIAVVDAFEASAHQARERVDYAEFCLSRDRADEAHRLATEALELVGDGELADSRNRASALLAQLAP